MPIVAKKCPCHPDPKIVPIIIPQISQISHSVFTDIKGNVLKEMPRSVQKDSQISQKDN